MFKPVIVNVSPIIKLWLFSKRRSKIPAALTIRNGLKESKLTFPVDTPIGASFDPVEENT